MKNKIARLYTVTIFMVVALGITMPLAAQQNINTASPYSRFGLGDIQFNSSPRYMGMGGVTQALNDSTYINFDNPASYTALGKYTLFDVGARASFLNLSTSQASAKANTINFSHLFISFPMVYRKWAMNFGVIPYSNEGYSFSSSQPLPPYNPIKLQYQGSGGVNSVVWGNAVTLYRGLRNRSKTVNPDTVSNATMRKIMRDTMPEVRRLSLGVNISYLFGNLNSQSSAIMPDTAFGFNSRQIRTTRIDGLSALFGLQYTQRFKKNDGALTLGLTYGLGQNVWAKENLFIGSYISSGDIDFYIDTLKNETNKKGFIKLPASYGVGFTYRQGNTWVVGADFKMTNWNGYRYFGQPDNLLNNSYQVSAGAQYVPDYSGKNLSLRRAAYRIGAHYGRTYLNLNNTPLNEWGVTLGFGLLLNPSGFYQKIFKAPFSSMNIGFEYGQRGTTSNNLIKEDFIRLSLGFTFSDKWFNKYKYD